MPHYSSPDAKPLSEWIGGRSGSPGSLLERARMLADMTSAVRQWSRAPWGQNIRVANLRGDVVVVFSSSAAALVPLRSNQKALIDFINARYQLSCTRLETKVRP